LKIGILIHAYYLDVLPEIFSYINNIKEDFTILISVPIGKGREAMTILKNHHYTNYILKEVENVGFDIAPMFCAFQKEIFEYDLICKIHTKKSTHNSQEFGMEWRKFCLETLLKNEKQTTKIIKEFNLHTDLGIIYSPGFPPVMDWIKRNGANLNQIEKNLPELLIPSSYKNLVWPMGSFFWFRPDSLKPIFEQNFTLKDFEPKDFSLYDEKGIARDLTLAHSLERVFCYIARSGGYKTFQLSDTIFDDKLKFEKTFKKSGICPVCNTKTVFFSPDDWFRDHYHCKHCNSIPRNRAIFHVLNTIDKDWKLKRLHESSPNNLYFANVVDNYSSSQFYPDEVLGKIIEGNRNENLEKLTFADEEFDYFITLDVMEHVFNPGEAILEMLRATKKDGTVVFTVPIHKHVEYSIQRARQNKNNRVEYLLPEYYHGNPVGDGKSLVTWDYGQDFKTLVQNWIGNNFEIHIFNEPVEEMGIIGDYLDVIVIKKI
jgi:SAM-dependent methyltransferase